MSSWPKCMTRSRLGSQTEKLLPMRIRQVYSLYQECIDPWKNFFKVSEDKLRCFWLKYQKYTKPYLRISNQIPHNLFYFLRVFSSHIPELMSKTSLADLGQVGHSPTCSSGRRRNILQGNGSQSDKQSSIMWDKDIHYSKTMVLVHEPKVFETNIFYLLSYWEFVHEEVSMREYGKADVIVIVRQTKTHTHRNKNTHTHTSYIHALIVNRMLVYTW